VDYQEKIQSTPQKRIRDEEESWHPMDYSLIRVVEEVQKLAQENEELQYKLIFSVGLNVLLGAALFFCVLSLP
jgi:hypothetical protein